MAVEPVRLNGRVLALHKATVRPEFGVRTVLTNSPWRFVNLWLKRNKEHDALFYWEQAEQFYDASRDLPLQSAPLLLYYSFMNATKALLSAKHVAFDSYHGVNSAYLRPVGRRITLRNEGVRIKNQGILPSLSEYYAEDERTRIHTLRDLLFNMPFVHRTYCLTYMSQTEMYLPLKDPKYVFDTDTTELFFRARADGKAPIIRLGRNLPYSLVVDSDDPIFIRSRESIPWSNAKYPTAQDKSNLARLHSSLRKDLSYIHGSEPLWYVKRRISGARRLSRQPTTLTLAAMHRLSELCRYRPIELSSFLDGPYNWLLSEFIAMAPSQFIDEISSELTGHQIQIPNVRSPT